MTELNLEAIDCQMEPYTVVPLWAFEATEQYLEVGLSYWYEKWDSLMNRWVGYWEDDSELQFEMNEIDQLIVDARCELKWREYWGAK